MRIFAQCEGLFRSLGGLRLGGVLFGVVFFPSRLEDAAVGGTLTASLAGAAAQTPGRGGAPVAPL